ncbi:MAG: DNA translocase FtsK [Chloroflexi bacterium]|nr:DNA translocase FtsK [Chloroflexota bacterium]MDA1271439.1 DNA translocase FtsK [Chloroflexota bacterium]
MASSVGRKRRDAASPSIKEVVKGTPGSLIDALVVLAIGLSVGLYFGFSADAREWAIEALGYGWVPVGLWIAVTIATLRYSRRTLFSHWRHWTVAAALTAMSIGVLSTIFPPDGALEYVSLGGRWGAVLGGTPVILAVLKISGMALILPLVIRPKRAGWLYFRYARKGLLWFQLGLISLYIGASHTARFLDRRFRVLRYGVLRHSKGRSLLKLLILGPSKSPVRTKAFQGDLDEDLKSLESGLGSRRQTNAADDFGLMGADSDDEDRWAMPSSGLIPTWDSDEPAPRNSPGASRAIAAGKGAVSGAAADAGPVRKGKGGWQVPSVDLLSPPDTHHAPEAALQEMARLVETTLGDHGVRVEVTDIKAGPRIVRFGLVPGWVSRRGDGARAAIGLDKDNSDPSALERSRVKVQSILIREKDMALALKTPYLRIEAPVPGEALVGLEVPSPSPSKVHLREVMETSAFARIAAKGGLPIALGQDTGGSSVVLDLASLPHMLIAGATGSGKSVCINSIVASFLLTKTPDQLRILMVDPKRVELTPFNGIPHLIGPVIVDAHEVNTALRGLIREMLARYKLMEETGARNIDGYNKRAKDKMPFLVLIVDELADLMMVGGFEVEQNLVRLAQLGRATGIHLVLATQRPSVNVVTGLLKANIPARAAFAVASQVDSRVILDAIGAEKLLGKGDMLLLHNESPKPSRVQGTLVYDQEIDHMVEFWLSQEGPPVPAIDLGEPDVGEDGDGVDARIMEEARELAARNPQLTSSYLERRLKIGSRKAEEVMETLEEEGFFDPR